jgi:hypothetical protein
MAASLGPSWSLRTNNASPCCLTVFATAPAADVTTATHHGTARKGKDTATVAGYSVTFGTERGSLHYRNYPLLLTADSSFDGVGGSSSRAGGSGRGSHRSVDPSQICIEPTDQINLQGAVKGSIVNIVHAQCCYHSPSETATANASNAASSPVFLLLVDDDRGTATSASTTTAGMSAGSTMLSTSTSPKQHNSGAYAAHLVTARNGSFHKLPPYGAETTTSSMSSSLSDGIMKNKSTTTATASTGHQQSPRLGRKIHNTPNIANNQLKDNETNNNTTQSSGVPLPRMSCAVHHPETGYVYAAGTGVYGLPNSAALAVMEGLAISMMNSHAQQNYRHEGGDDDEDDYHNYSHQQAQRRHHPPPSSSGVHHPTPYSAPPTPSSSSIVKPMPPTALYLNCHHALPMPGVRCSSSGGHQNMTLACLGRVAIVAVANAFYAVPAYLNVNAIKSIAVTAVGNSMSSSSTASVIPTQLLSTLPNVSATKIASFAQSSQVHPVIAVEIVMSPPIQTMINHDRSSLLSLEGVISKYIRSVTSLVFLASGRECTTVEITSIPDNSAGAATGGSGAGGDRNKGDGGARSQSAVIASSSSSIGGGMVLSTTIKSMSHSKIHGMATLPSPILAAAPLPPVRQSTNGDGGGSGLSSGPLIALLTVDGLVHIRSPLCYAVPLTSLEVGTRLNDYFTLSTLQSFSSTLALNANNSNSQENRTIVATSYGGESRLISIYDTESSQDFADRLMRLCIDAFGSNGFPRLELAESLGATFLATSYGGSGGGGVQQELSTSSMTTTTLMQYHQKRTLLKQFLECVLGLADDILERVTSSSSAVVTASKLESNISNISVVLSEDGRDGGDVEVEAIDRYYEGMNENAIPSFASSLGANALLTCTALLCLVSFQLSPPDGSTAVRASRACASAVGIVLHPDKDSSFSSSSGIVSKTAVTVCELVADRLLKEVSSTLSSNFSLLTASSSVSNSSTSWGNRASLAAATMEFVETAIWLLRSCGCHEKAINVLQERMNSPAFRNASMGEGLSGSSSIGGTGGGGGWSQIKFDSYLATHLGELWSSNDDQCRQLVLESSATRDLISRNPTLGLSIFTTIHPRNETEWKMMKPEDDPLDHPFYPMKVVELLKSISPQQSSGRGGGGVDVHHEPGAIECLSSFSPWSEILPLNSGRALAVSYLESAIGIATGRQPTNASNSPDSLTSPSSYRTKSSRDEIDERKADVHDELSYLLLEGVISERGDDDGGVDSNLGAIYRFKLRRLLSWPDLRIRSERILSALPLSFLREHALVLGRLGRHEDALQILYFQEKSLDLALEYCDVRHERQQAQMEDAKASGAAPGSGPRGRVAPNQCAYIPLVKVALSMDPDIDRGTAAAIKVLALRRDRIDKAAVRLLPKNTPMSSLVRPFLIPAVVEDESQVRRLTIASSLLRSRMIQLKKKLVEAQLESQASLHSSPALQRLNLGALLHSSKSVAARPVHAASLHYPDVLLTKHFFPRHFVIQAQVTNNPATSMTDQNYARTLANVAFVIAESSDDALVPTMELPLKTLPHRATGSAWCVVAANPQRLDGAAFLTCELRFTVLTVDADTGMPLKFSESINSSIGLGQTFVEELHDIEVRHTEFG